VTRAEADAWAAECLQGPVVTVRLPIDKNRLN
jgi:hypothetical protein